MNKSDFYYKLPENLIAQTPLENRDQSRLMVIDKASGSILHKSFKDVIDYLDRGDCIVINDTKVIPARLLGNKKDSGGKIEMVLLKPYGDDKWEVLAKPGKRAKIGTTFVFGDNDLTCEVIDILQEGNRLVKFHYDKDFDEILDKVGKIPLPHYIKETLEDDSRYQTVYAKMDGSAAAPTAGLHFTDELFEKLKEKGIDIARITLHVGLGTFRPVKTNSIFDHKMHSEFYIISEEAKETINKAKKSGNKVIAVGTTCVRTLETVSDRDGFVKKDEGETDIFIYPGYKFKCVDSIITNFHLPESTLIMLVSAFLGKKKTLDAYKVAVENNYRFFSFGDAMYIGDVNKW